MGVDVSAYTLYGVTLDEPYWFMSEEDYGEDIKGNYEIVDNAHDYIQEDKIFVISDEIINKYGLEIAFDHYSFSWQVLGLYYLGNDVKDTINRLNGLEERWNNLMKDLDLPIDKYKPSFICDYYYW